MYGAIKQLNYHSCLLYFDNLAAANLHWRVNNYKDRLKVGESGRAEYVYFVKQFRIDLILQLTKFMILSCYSA